MQHHALDAHAQLEPTAPRTSVVRRVLLHGACLLIALMCLVGYAVLKSRGLSSASVASLIAAAGFGFVPLRDLLRVAFSIESKALHLVHALGGLALVALPLTGVVSGTGVLTHTAMAPFAIMGAAQALMHSNHPRNATQAAALQRFVSSLPELAQFSSKNLASPENATRAVAVLSDIVAKAQALGETELEADPAFQSAFRRVSTQFGTNLELDAVDLALNKLESNPATAGAAARLRKQVATARTMFKAAPRRSD